MVLFNSLKVFTKALLWAATVVILSPLWIPVVVICSVALKVKQWKEEQNYER